MFDLAELGIRLIDSFVTVFGLIGQVFKYRPWMIPLLPVALMVIYVGVRIRRVGAGTGAQRRRPVR